MSAIPSVEPERILRITRFPNVSAQRKEEFARAWPDLIAMLDAPESYTSKTDAPLLKLATFGERRSEKGALRSDDNMLVITGIEGDYDGEIVTPTEAIDMLERHGIRACIYTSPSHTDEKPRWRVLAPLSVDLPSEHRDRLIRRLNGALGGILTGESFTKSQTYYFGKVNGHPYQCLATFGDPTDGTCINELNALDDIAIGPPRSSSTQAGEVATDEDLRNAILSGENYHEALCSLGARFAGRGLEPADIVATLTGLMDASKGPHDARWKSRRDEIPRMTDGAIRKYQRDGKPKEQQATTPEPPDYATEQIPDDASSAGQAPDDEDIERNERNRTKSSKPYTIILAKDFRIREDVGYFIKQIWPPRTFGVTWGPSGGGKSYVTADMVLHVASGREWCGRRVRRAGVVYLGAEAAESMERRFIAMADQAGLNRATLPLAILSGALHMLRDPDRIIAAITEAAALLRSTFEVSDVLLIVDTLARSAPGMDENGPEDMGEYVGVCDRLRLELGLAVVVIHHAGKDLTRGARGHGALKAAADVELMIADHQISIEKLRDGATGISIPFELHPVELAKDSDGDPIIACWVEYGQETGARAKANTRISPTTQIGFEALREAIREHGEPLPETSKLPGGKPACTVEQWRMRFYGRTSDRELAAQKKAFQRAKDDLMARGIIGAWESKVWIW